ncbi:MAG: flagellar biosynthesis protein FlgH [Sphingomonas sp. 28-63-12]|nr:MAG: flagellar biosynthesis protein FlgH [Sphingomonas sp. 28-63-12]
MSIRTSDPSAAGHDSLVKFAAGIALGAMLVAAFAPAPASASIFGRKQPKPDFSVTMPPPPPPPAPADGAIFKASAGYAPLYEGWRARRVGDPLTIVLVERTLASKSASSKLDSKGNVAINPPAVGPLSFVPPNSLQADGGRGFTGAGTADQSNSLSGEVSVTVAEVFPNGTMRVQGGKRVTLNRGDEYVQIKGLVRWADVDADNRVMSTRVADAQISYTGKGDVARASRQGWFNRFFAAISPF